MELRTQAVWFPGKLPRFERSILALRRALHRRPIPLVRRRCEFIEDTRFPITRKAGQSNDHPGPYRRSQKTEPYGASGNVLESLGTVAPQFLLSSLFRFSYSFRLPKVHVS